MPRSRVQGCFELLDGSASLLFLLPANGDVGAAVRAPGFSRGIRRVIVNQGATVATLLADIKIDAALGEVLPTLVGAPE